MLYAPGVTLSTKARGYQKNSAINIAGYLIILDLFMFAPFPGGERSAPPPGPRRYYFSFIRL